MKLFIFYDAVNWKGDLTELYFFTNPLDLMEIVEGHPLLSSKKKATEFLHKLQDAKNDDEIDFGDEAILVREI